MRTKRNNTEERNEMMSGDDQRSQPQAAGEDLQEEIVAAPGEALAESLTVEALQDALSVAQEELAKKTAEAAEYLDNWRRSSAELSNARKRMLREQEEARATCAQRVLEKLLPVLDDIDRACAALPENQVAGDWASGFRAIQRKLQALLESEGVTPIQTEGQVFDPMLHYAVTHEEVEGYNEGQIIGEAARGYMLHDKVLRPSMVRVAKGNHARSNHP
jgi:molecular chaperone GrpE